MVAPPAPPLPHVHERAYPRARTIIQLPPATNHINCGVPCAGVYYYENIEGGHGGAADADQRARVTALIYDFMAKTL